MKHISIFSFFMWLISPTTAVSQITSSFFPAIDDTIYMSSANSNISVNAGGDGSGQSWNFSQFIGSQIDTVVFQDPVTAGYGTDFPSADVFQKEEVVQESFSLPAFFDVTPSAVYEVGQILNNPGTPLVLSLEEPLMYLPIPSDLGTSFRDTSNLNATVEGSFVGIPADSVRFERIVYRQDTISASGSLQLSSGYYPNVLRKTTTDYWIDSIYTFNNGVGWQFLQDDDREVVTHRWIDPGQPFSLAELREEDGDSRGFRARPFDQAQFHTTWSL